MSVAGIFRPQTNKSKRSNGSPMNMVRTGREKLIALLSDYFGDEATVINESLTYTEAAAPILFRLLALKAGHMCIRRRKIPSKITEITSDNISYRNLFHRERIKAWKRQD